MAAVGLLAACTATPEAESVTPSTSSSRTAPSEAGSPGGTAPDGRPFLVEEIGELDEPWAMTFLPEIGRAHV